MMEINDIRVAYTVIMFVFFIAVCFWALSKRNKKRFNDAANLLFDEKEEKMHKASVKEISDE
ncbi:MAG: cbb3-type cytochrome c oxidase subunit 3 [Gammaproteobacteria bacterium]|nr:cbb3-type cytochrome c oxidase subunit 3 [Gammaproteobacteria bacterium]